MSNAYQRLCETFTRLARFSHLDAIAGWDMQTCMPSGGSAARTEALTELRILSHQILTDPHVGELLQQAQQEPLSDEQHASLREMARRYGHAVVLPESLVSAQALAGMHCEHAWREQRRNNDWQGFLKNFTEVVRLSREEAQIRAQASGLSRYDALLDRYEPGMTAARLDAIFAQVKQWLPSLLQQIIEKQRSQTLTESQGPFSVEQQRALGVDVMGLLGFDFNHGRLDVSAHPFCGGVPDDVRITTRYNEQDFLGALLGIIHETGHARYEQNLPRQWAGLPIAEARSTAIHESQSLLFEMQLARGTPFLNVLRPYVQKHFGDQNAFHGENFIRINHRVQPGFIRIDADEVSYPAHVILRYEIERALIEGEIEAGDIPEIWNKKMMDYLGLDTRGNYRDGCMQDIHWTDGAFGYFPTYTLGAMYAAQLFAAVRRCHPSLDENIAHGDLSLLFTWLRENIWQHGSRFDTDTLIRNATGETLNPEWFRRHIEQRYLS
ncbi:carboxypeptidase M32 [Enterobacillus tribolii]|uniref:Metal-dependent carboxypeptidase n=1 Tax=Enterobacillus tribolii TaxID=1487935 RepID=A0A370R468_9GAMM|nr:carboxypeptidase M32 [Enterobacillus tribolii]MBW7983162.1 carboxypeptidase M32 [Enterobacillus tribolii]RDK97217.1 carboxypeptidase Taq [Enterobacillus tribolii]